MSPLLTLGAAPDLSGGLCAETDPEIFFPAMETRRAIAEARSICRRCAVMLDCREWAVGNPHQSGIAGGLTERERRALRRRRGHESV